LVTGSKASKSEALILLLIITNDDYGYFYNGTEEFEFIENFKEVLN
jgi:hypothetical protein